MASKRKPTIIAVEAHGNKLSWRLRDVSDVFRSAGLVEYQTLTPPCVTIGRVRSTSAARALTRTERLIETMKTWRVLPASAATGWTVLSNRRSGAHFTEVTWTRALGDSSRHWMRVRPPVVRQETIPTSIRFVTGTCLFGRSDAVALLADGSRRSLVSARLPLASPI